MRATIDRSGIAEMSRDPRLSGLMLPAARACRETARTKAPVRFRVYQRSMFAAKLARGVGAFYGSDDTKALLMEYGSKNNKAFHTLRNAARTHRLRLVERVR